MEEGEIRPDSPPPPRRYAPYPPRPPRPAAAGGERQTNYHWLTLCAVRDRMLRAYEKVYDVHDMLRAGETPPETQMRAILLDMSDVLACRGCGAVVPKLDKGCFVAKCGHVYHKAPANCWEAAGNNCNAPQCADGAHRRGG